MLFYPIYPFCNYALKKQKLNQTPEPIYWWYWFQEELQIVLKSWRLRWLSPDDFFRFILIYESKDNSQTLNSANYTTLSCVSQDRGKTVTDLFKYYLLPQTQLLHKYITPSETLSPAVQLSGQHEYIWRKNNYSCKPVRWIQDW